MAHSRGYWVVFGLLAALGLSVVVYAIILFTADTSTPMSRLASVINEGNVSNKIKKIVGCARAKSNGKKLPVFSESRETFESILKKHPVVVALFFTDWCGHCKVIKPKFTEAAQTAGDTYPHFIQVDGTIRKDLLQQFGIRGFPTILKFHNGVKVDTYRGNRQVQDILRFANDKIPPL